MSRALLSYISAAGRRKCSSGIRWSRSQFLDLKRAKHKWGLQGTTKTTAAWYLLLFLLPRIRKEGTKEVHARKINVPVNGKISLIIFPIHSPETFLRRFKQNLKVFQLPLVAKYLSREGTLGSSPSKKTTDLDQGKVWKAHSLIWELFFTPCLLTHMVVRLSH